jgi:hypothetical protein
MNLAAHIKQKLQSDGPGDLARLDLDLAGQRVELVITGWRNNAARDWLAQQRDDSKDENKAFRNLRPDPEEARSFLVALSTAEQNGGIGIAEIVGVITGQSAPSLAEEIGAWSGIKLSRFDLRVNGKWDVAQVHAQLSVGSGRSYEILPEFLSIGDLLFDLWATYPFDPVRAELTLGFKGTLKLGAAAFDVSVRAVDTSLLRSRQGPDAGERDRLRDRLGGSFPPDQVPAELMEAGDPDDPDSLAFWGEEPVTPESLKTSFDAAFAAGEARPSEAPLFSRRGRGLPRRRDERLFPAGDPAYRLAKQHVAMGMAARRARRPDVTAVAGPAGDGSGRRVRDPGRIDRHACRRQNRPHVKGDIRTRAPQEGPTLPPRPCSGARPYPDCRDPVQPSGPRGQQHHDAAGIGARRRCRDAAPGSPGPQDLAVSLKKRDAVEHDFDRVFGPGKNGRPPAMSVGRLPLDPPPGRADAPWADIGRARLRDGFVPLHRSTYDGLATVAWFRGPLRPTFGERDIHIPGPALPERAADLIGPTDASGLADASHATAWSLGRLLGLRDRRFCARMLAWRRGCVQAMHHASCADRVAHLPVCAADHLNVPFPEEFFARLAVLDGVPFRYLVPAEPMLPTESLRFFTVDPLWIYRMLQGAFSIGREACRCAEMEAKPLARLRALIPSPLRTDRCPVEST